MTSVIGDVEANCQKVKNLIEKYLDKSTDVLVLPEVWTVVNNFPLRSITGQVL